MDSSRPLKLSVNKRVCRKKQLKLHEGGFVCFSFGFQGFHLKKLKIVQLKYD